MSTPALAAQLIVFSSQVDLEAQMDQVLAGVHAAGFEAIECGSNQFAEAPEAFVKLLEKHQLRVAGLHGGLNLEPDVVMRLLDHYQANELCISGIGGWEGTSSEQFRADTQQVNEIGRILARHGYHVHYHNHAYEFARLDNGQTGMEVIIQELDPAVADLCVDVAWVHIGGLDPVEFLRSNRERISYVHLKDYIDNRRWVELGSGVVPLAKVVATMPELDVRWMVYEQDSSDKDAVDSCAISHAYLRGLGV
ncbi:MAG: sugar phosphate isomerase/epimerase [Chloroflexi bacterium]|nr:sugar phosphate isomerase/epimerase [Chloroflexota bacterium]